MNALLICALAFAADGRAEKDAAILKAMQGTWVVTAYENYGTPAKTVGGEFEIAGNKIQARPSGELRSTFQIDTTKDPMHIDVFAPKGGGQHRLDGIFVLDGQTLKIRLSGGNRPTQIEDGGGREFVILQRKPEKAK